MTTDEKVKPNVAKAIGRDLSISTKQSIEVCNHIRNKTVKQARQILEDAIALKRAIPFKRFTNGLGHKKGMAAGRYAPSTCKAILAVVNSAVANAENKGLQGTTIVHINAQQAARPYHYGRKRRAKMKKTHIEVIVGEAKA
jgi:large subunit ribosomal protein L22